MGESEKILSNWQTVAWINDASKERYIGLIVEELGKMNNEDYFKIIYALVQKYRKGIC